MNRRSSSRGYTIIEVLATMTLFAIGAAGVISMQQVTIKGGDDARRFDVATNVAREWTSRLQRDAMTWTLPDADNPAAENFSTTTWLGAVSSPDVWTRPAIPTTAGNADSPAFDLLGRDLLAGSGDHMFCVQYRLAWISQPPGGGAWPLGIFMRAEIRVIWNRLETPISGDCGSLPLSYTAADEAKYHFVYVTTALRSNPAK